MTRKIISYKLRNKSLPKTLFRVILIHVVVNISVARENLSNFFHVITLWLRWGQVYVLRLNHRIVKRKRHLGTFRWTKLKREFAVSFNNFYFFPLFFIAGYWADSQKGFYFSFLPNPTLQILSRIALTFRQLSRITKSRKFLKNGKWSLIRIAVNSTKITYRCQM